MRKKLIVGTAAAMLALTVAGVALAALQLSYSEKFTTKARHRSTGTKLNASYTDPAGTNGRPAATKRVIITYPRGTTSNTNAAPQCNVSNAQLMQSSARKLCPAGSRYGSGYVLVRGTSGGDSKVDLFVYNRRRAAIFEFEINGQAVAGFNARFVGRVIDTGNLGDLPGDLRVTKLVLNTNARSRRVNGKRVRLLTTPRSCPSSHRWTITGDFRFKDGTRYVKRSKTRCTP